MTVLGLEWDLQTFCFFSPIFSGVVWVSPGRDDCSLGFLFFCCQEWNLICRCSRSATRCDVMCILTRCSSRPGRNQRLFALPSPSCRLKPVCTVSSSPAGRVLFILLLPFTRYTMSVFHKVDILTSTRPKRETFTYRRSIDAIWSTIYRISATTRTFPCAFL